MDAGSLGLLIDIDRTQRRNLRRERWEQFKASRSAQVRAGVMISLLIITAALLISIYPHMTRPGLPPLDPRALRLVGLLVLFLGSAAALPGYIREVREPWETDLFFVSPVRRSAFVHKNYIDGIAGLLWTVVTMAFVAALMMGLFIGGPSLSMIPRAAAGLALLALALRNAGYLIGGWRLRRRLAIARGAILSNGLALAALGLVAAFGMQLARRGLAGTLDDVWGLSQAPAAAALLSPLNAVLDIAFFAPAGPALAAELLAFTAFIAVTSTAIAFYDFRVYEDHDDPGREVAVPRRRAFPLVGRLKVDFPDLGEAHWSIASVNLYTEFRKGIAGSVVSLLIVAGVAAYLTRFLDLPFNMITLLLLPVILTLFPMAIGGWSLKWDDPDVMLLLPLDRTLQARSHLLSAFTYQLIAWYGTLLVVSVAGFKFHPVVSAVAVVLAPFLLFYVGVLHQYFSCLDLVMGYHEQETSGLLDRIGDFAFEFGQGSATLGMAILQVLLVWQAWRTGIEPHLAVLPLAALDLAVARLALRSTGGRLENLTRQGVPRRKKWSLSGATLGAVIGPLLLVALSILAPLALNTAPHGTPAASSGLYLGSDRTINSTVLSVPGTLIVGENVTVEMHDVRALVDCRQDGTSGIYVLGTLLAENCTFGPANGTGNPVFRVKGTLRAVNCTFSSLWGDRDFTDRTGGLELRGAGSMLQNCTVSGGRTNGILCLEYTAITGCRVYGNSDDGIEFRDEGGDLVDSVVEGNGNGIHAHSVGQLNITGCAIRSNRGDGIFTVISDLRIERTEISENGGYGIRQVRVLGDELAISDSAIVLNLAGNRRQERFDPTPGFEAGPLLAAIAAVVSAAAWKRRRPARPAAAEPPHT